MATAEVVCPNCDKSFKPPKTAVWKNRATAGGVVAGAVIGGVHGAGVGIAGGGAATVATVPMGIAAGAILGLGALDDAQSQGSNPGPFMTRPLQTCRLGRSPFRRFAQFVE